MASKNGVTETAWASKQKEAFEYSWMKQTDDFARLISLQRTYDNAPSSLAWPTRSKIPMPWAWIAVEAALGPALDYLFPPSPWFRLIGEKGQDADQVDNATWALYLMMRNRMRIKHASVRSLKDCFKVGLGYGIIEPITVTPPARMDVSAGGNVAAMMGKGAPKRSLRQRYLSPGKVLPYPSGVDFNGEDPTPYSWVLDMVPEYRFAKMFEDAPRDSSGPVLKGDPDAMIEEARKHGFHTQTTYAEVYDLLAGRKTGARGPQSGRYKAPCMVPILKAFAIDEGRHTWFFPGTVWQEIWDKSDSYDTTRNPCVKYDAWMDGDRWFPMSMAEAQEKVIWEKNILVNAINDLISMGLKRPLVWNQTVQHEPPNFGPNNTMGVPGEPDKMAKYLDGPRIDPATWQLTEEINQVHTDITGQRNMAERNFTRGGTQAFSELLATTEARTRLRNMLLETGGFESSVWQTLIYMQTLGGGMDLDFEQREYDYESGRDVSKWMTVTEDDLKHGYGLMLDIESKYRDGSMDVGSRIALYNAKRDNPYFDQYEVAADLEPDADKRQRQLLPRAEVRRKQAERESVELQAMAQGGRAAGLQPPALEPSVAGREMGGA